MTTDDGVDASDGFDPHRWLETITYAEIHAFGIGAALLFLAALSNSEEIFFLYLGIALMSLRDPKGQEGEDGTAAGGISLPTKYTDQIRREFHYFAVGGLVGDRIGAVVFRSMHSHWPTYYEEIPQVVETLLGGII